MGETAMIENLIGKVHAEILKSEAIIQAHEEDFNIFQITKIGEKEETLHTRFIAELLNPRGTHKMNDVFLIQFMKLINSHLESNHDFKQISNFSGIHVHLEKSIGRINEDYTQGGSIDIILRFNNGNYLIIENKVFARDQKGQLRRYYNAFFDSPKVMVYLTLDGKKAHDYSTMNNNNELHPKIEPVLLSYKEHILSWLNECKKEVVDKPAIREVISQYINQIRTLTKQTTRNQMSMNTEQIILQDENSIKAAREIAESLKNIKDSSKHKLELVLKDLEDIIKKNSDSKYLHISTDIWNENDEPTLSFFFGMLELEREIEIMLYYNKDNFKAQTEICSAKLGESEIMAFRDQCYANIGEFDFEFHTATRHISEEFEKLIKIALEVYSSNNFRNQT